MTPIVFNDSDTEQSDEEESLAIISGSINSSTKKSRGIIGGEIIGVMVNKTFAPAAFNDPDTEQSEVDE